MTESQRSDRREFVRRLVSLGGVAGLAGLSFGKLAEKTRVLTPVYAQADMLIDENNDGGTGTTQLASTAGGTFVFGAAPEGGTLRLENDRSVSDITSPTPIALVAYAKDASGISNPPAINGGVGVWGQSDSVAGVGLYGLATAGTGSNFGVIGWSDSIGGVGVRGIANAGTGSTIGVDGRSESSNGTGVRGLAGVAGAKPMVAQGASGQTANLQEWQNSLGTALSAVQPNGAMIAPQLGQGSPNSVLSTPGNPSGFTNVNPTFKMDGLAVSFTPKLTGNVIVFVNLDQYNTSYPANVYAQLRYGTGTAPGFGASATGTQVGPTLSFSTGVASQIAHGSINIPITGLTVNTTYWFDLAGAVFATGTGFHNNISILILEI